MALGEKQSFSYSILRRYSSAAKVTNLFRPSLDQPCQQQYGSGALYALINCHVYAEICQKLMMRRWVN